MLIAFCGDTHGNILTMYEMVSAWEKRTRLEVDLVVQVGDFGFWLEEGQLDGASYKHRLREVGKARILGDFPDFYAGTEKAPYPTLVIRGNHEDQEFLLRQEEDLKIRVGNSSYVEQAVEIVPNIYYLPDGHTWTYKGVKFGGLGGCFSTKTWANWGYEDAARWKRTKNGEKRRLNHFTRDRWEWLLHEKMDVLLTHDAPSGSDVQGNPFIELPEDEMTDQHFSSCGCPHLRELIETIEPAYHFCGHWHQYRQNFFGETTSFVLDKVDFSNPSLNCMEIIELPKPIVRIPSPCQ